MIDVTAKQRYAFVNDRHSLFDFYDSHKKSIFIGFNSRHYDQYIFKGILSGFDPKKINDWIIVDDRPGWQFSSTFRNVPLNNYDVMANIDRGLKVFEGFMGNDIRETSVPFDIDRKLTPEEIAETLEYCTHDVEQTIEVFMERKEDFEASIGLLKMFNLPLSDINKTKVQLIAKILNASPREYDDEFDIDFPKTARIEKYTNVLDWYKDPHNLRYRDEKGKKTSLQCIIAGVPHVFGWGGVHGAREKYHGKGYYLMIDVTSLYPMLMIIYGLLSRSCDPDKFKSIVDLRVKLKHEGNPLQKALKPGINGTYGATKDRNNPLYDPRQANRVCVYGQILILDLIEKLEDVCTLIQSNTDGLFLKLWAETDEEADIQYALIDDICYEWEQRTGLSLEFDEYREVFQKDVNNYILIAEDGHIKSKGAYVKKLGRLDYDLPIVNKALVDYMVERVPIEETILSCDELIQFQTVKRISNKYAFMTYGGQRLKERTVRAFASTDPSDGGLMKMKHERIGKSEKVASTPEHCFLDNGNILTKKCPSKLDKQWYIDIAKKRLTDFGVV